MIQNMLGEQIEELRGKITGQRVLSVEPLTIETSVSSSGTIRGIQVTQLLTFLGTPATTPGVIHGKGGGIIMMAGSAEETAIFRGEGIGRINPSGGTKWRGAIFFTTSSTGRLAFLNNIIGLFEAEFDAQGNQTHKSWEWK